MAAIPPINPKVTEALEVINAGEPDDLLRHRAWKYIERVFRLNGFIGAVQFEAYFDALVDPITICFITENEEQILRTVTLVLDGLILVSHGNNLGKLRVLEFINQVVNGYIVGGDIRLKLVLEMLCPIVVNVMFRDQLTGAIDTVERMILSGVRNTECRGPEGRETFIQNLIGRFGQGNLREQFKDEVVRRLVKRLHMINKKDGEQDADFVAKVERFLKQKEIKAECYNFDAAINLHPLGLDWSTRNHGPFPKSRGVFGGHQRRCIVLDIVGTTTPISFVMDVLLKYSCANVGRHLDLTYDSTETQNDIKLLRYQVHNDLQGLAGAVPIPSKYAGKEGLIAALVTNVKAMVRANWEITALKKLLVDTARTGLQNHEIEMQVFHDVPEALKKWHASGIKAHVAIETVQVFEFLFGNIKGVGFISQFFANTDCGDLRKYLCGFFDSVVGSKQETGSYLQISKFLGVDKPSEILFLMDNYEEAIAAEAGGFEVILSVRPGNGPLPENHGFKTVNSLLEI